MSFDQEKPPTSAAAMDALDLDDLFLGTGVDDEDDVVGGVDGPDSLFANMEIDLGDMGGIFDNAGVDATNNNKAGGKSQKLLLFRYFWLDLSDAWGLPMNFLSFWSNGSVLIYISVLAFFEILTTPFDIFSHFYF